MHPTLTFDLIQADHRERLETAALLRRDAERRADRRRTTGSRGRPPERLARPRLRLLLVATTAAGTVR
ncbi:hypothetical protein [Cellulomonas triticagri]|uniref:Uncharacterized protein n=1 Tax=Cellulomonas triticagri TaxID=2483352 RepID=A0A3M2J913_9CELL|nr:hypothetical protein [Cellulomonas triticagri]RMI06968.1 hypothetical protein EBM89_14435 [Cellulomonas triticagri]